MLALEKLTRVEKLQLMEILWEDLSANAADLPSPAWHEYALNEAQTAFAKGDAVFVDWASAKRQLRGE